MAADLGQHQTDLTPQGHVLSGDESDFGACAAHLALLPHILRAVGEAIAEVEQQYEVVRTQSFSETVSYLRVGHV